MLTASALLIVFIYSRFLATFRKLFDLEQEYKDKVKAVWCYICNLQKNYDSRYRKNSIVRMFKEKKIIK